MLNSSETLLLNQVRTFLRNLSTPAANALAAQLDAALLASAQHAATVAAKNRNRPKSAYKGKQPHAYVLDVQPGWQQQVLGAKGAAAALAQALKDLGSNRQPPSPAGLAAMLGKNGQWATVVETDNGTVAISITKTGTDLAKARRVPTSENKT